jgi:hypothetical protein
MASWGSAVKARQLVRLMFPITDSVTTRQTAWRYKGVYSADLCPSYPPRVLLKKRA